MWYAGDEDNPDEITSGPETELNDDEISDEDDFDDEYEEDDDEDSSLTDDEPDVDPATKEDDE